MKAAKIRGLIAPILTPFNDDLSVAADLYEAVLRDTFASLIPGLVFGSILNV